MKYLILGFVLFFTNIIYCQSPLLTINVVMDLAKVEGKRYKIEMNICKPKKMTVRESWFSHDTSTIDFTSLKSNEIECGGYFDKGMPTLISGPEEKPLFNQFQFSNEVFAWEYILIFKISDWSSRGWNPEMYIVIPIKYKSFWTHIDITDIEFLSGKVVFLTELVANYEGPGSSMAIQQSLKDEKGIEVKDFPLKELLEKGK